MSASGAHGPPGRDDSGRIDCPHAPRCPGCTQLGLSVTERTTRKRSRVLAAFGRYPALRAVQIAEAVAADPELGYRTRAKLVVDAQARIGLYQTRSHDVVDIPDCRVLPPAMACVIERVRALVRAAPGAVAAVDARELRHAGTTALFVTLIGPPDAARDQERIAHELARLPEVLGVARSARDPGAPTVLGRAPQVVLGPRAARDALDGHGPYHLATYGSFAQAHRGQAAALTAALLERLDRALDGLRGRRVLELYAGAGALSLRMAQRGAQVLANERFAPIDTGVERAAREQAISGVAFDGGDAADLVERLAQDAQAFDAVVANPPRRGLTPRLRAALPALRPRAIAYVSCDPETLARDLDHLARLGYAARALQPYDMIPLSESVESVVLLERAELPALPILFEDAGLIAVDKPPYLPTTPQGEHAGSLLEVLRRQRGLATLTPVHRLDEGTSGICLFAKDPSLVGGLAAALAAGEKHYLALVRGIARPKGSISRPLLERGVARAARTRYTRLELLGGHSLVRVRPDQGRKHQVRRHMASIGHPVLGDPRHGDRASNRHLELRYGLDRTFLHLGTLELRLPHSAEPARIEAPLPGDLSMVCDRLRQSAMPLDPQDTHL